MHTENLTKNCMTINTGGNSVREVVEGTNVRGFLSEEAGRDKHDGPVLDVRTRVLKACGEPSRWDALGQEALESGADVY